MVQRSPSILVAVVNDYPVVVSGLTRLLEPYRPKIRVERYVQAMPHDAPFDVVLLDIFGRPEGLDRLREVVEETGAPVLLYTWAQSQEEIDAAIHAGATGVLPKTLDADEIVTALRATIAGHVPRPAPAPDHAPMLTFPGQEEGLSARESEILCLIVAGLSNQEIAERCYLSINSIKTYIRSAYRKIGVTTRTQAVLWGIDHGFRLELV
jgi:two-component system, NarL family, response regulator LiaR